VTEQVPARHERAPGARQVEQAPRSRYEVATGVSRPKTVFVAVFVAVLVAALAAACGGPSDDGTTPAPGPSPATGSTSSTPSQTPTKTPTKTRTREPRPAYSTWELGAHPLPLRPDGFGEIRPTPRSLRERRYPTRDLLPPPTGERFESTIGPVTPELRRRMGTTWSPRCPVGLDGLRYLTVTFRGYDGAAHTGELVVAAEEAEAVVSVFRALYAADFPIEEMRVPGTADLEAHPTGDGNNTVGLVCRPSRGLTQWSAHAYGLAIDLNPFVNPYVRDDLVLPELASSYIDRSWRRPGMVLEGDLAVREFARIGWSWGGDWSSLKDYQHFTALDR